MFIIHVLSLIILSLAGAIYSLNVRVSGVKSDIEGTGKQVVVL